MQTYSQYQNAALLILRIITAAIFYVAAYYKFPFWSGAPEGISPFMLFVTRLLSISEPLGAFYASVEQRDNPEYRRKPWHRQNLFITPDNIFPCMLLVPGPTVVLPLGPHA
jgi:hypothetical protein